MPEVSRRDLTTEDFNAGRRLLEACTPRVSESQTESRGNRLNLVLPFLSEKWIFGGIATALRLFERLAEEFMYKRILVMYETQTQFDSSGWPGWILDGKDVAPRSLAFLADGSSNVTLTESDYFLATFWSTAVYVQKITQIQARLYGMPRRRFTYLIQDYEPGFYPASANSVIARSTYDDRDAAIAVFNSRPLAEYFWRSGYNYADQYLYDPMLHPALRRRRAETGPYVKERLILVYGRPAHLRNGFEIILDGLALWAASYAGARNWSVVSVGGQHDDIPLANEVTLKCQGKLSLEQYADFLSRSWIGVSFIFSPHPGYTALEMGEFGSWVITNSYENKRPSELGPNFVPVEEMAADSIAAALSECCSRYQSNKTTVSPTFTPVLRSDGDEFPFAGSLINCWLQK